MGAILMACTACGYPALAPICGDIICGPGQECAANQPVCIDIGGCGNGIIDIGEVCDDGNIVDGEMDNNGVFVLDQCNHNCASTQECGNGIKDTGEACDDGKLNGTTNDTCDTTCHLINILCGNSIVDQDKGEICDPGPTDSASCNYNMAGSASCKPSKCGDGYTNMVAGEKCDSSGIDTAGCNGLFCTLPTCGDNYITCRDPRLLRLASCSSVPTSTPRPVKSARAEATTRQRAMARVRVL